MSIAVWCRRVVASGLLTIAVSGAALAVDEVEAAYNDALLSENIATLPALEDALVKSIDGAPDIESAEATRRMLATRVLVGATSLSTVSSSRVLCQVNTFTLQDSAMEVDLRAKLHVLLAEALQAEDYGAARSFDCALNNFKDGYFDYSRSLTALFSDMLDRDPSAVVEQIEQLTDLGDQLRSDLSSYRESYYLVRLDQRMATLAAAKAVWIARLAAADERPAESDIAAALQAAAASLDRSLDVETLSGARNGWRLYGDLKFHQMFYQAASETPDAERLKALRAEGASFPPALKMVGFETSIEPDVRRLIERDAPDYVDPVYVDRLFPGAADTAEDDKKAWRKQAFNAASFTDRAATCLSAGKIDDLKALQALDMCMAALENNDWWVQLGAYANDAQARREADRLASEIRRQSDKADFGGRDVALKVAPPDRLSALYRVRTDMALSRTEAEKVRSLVAGFDRRRDTLIGRSKQY